MQLATFKVDVTCPVGHPLCAGWTPPAVGVSDPLYAVGVVIYGADRPVVLCAVDWCEISNRSHVMWRESIAVAAGTDADHVAVQTTHPHCTPWPDDEAQGLVREHGVRDVMQTEFCHGAIERVARAVTEATNRREQVTHFACGRAKIDQVASNRRVMGDDGNVWAVRWTATKEPEVRAAPEGLIDPYLKSIGFWQEDRKLAAMHYYAVHNTSYDGDMVITNDFLGLARERRADDEPEVAHIFFNECAGNVTAGKYNDGARENRELFTQRVYDGIASAEADAERFPLSDVSWKVEQVFLPPGEDMNEPDLLAILSDTEVRTKDRIKAAIKIAGLRRQHLPIPFGCLSIDDTARILHLPGESFIEYQLYAQERSAAAWTAVPSYGDCGPGYICMDRSYGEGGYEPVDSFVSPGVEGVMKAAIDKLL